MTNTIAPIRRSRRRSAPKPCSRGLAVLPALAGGGLMALGLALGADIVGLLTTGRFAEAWTPLAYVAFGLGMLLLALSGTALITGERRAMFWSGVVLAGATLPLLLLGSPLGALGIYGICLAVIARAVKPY